MSWLPTLIRYFHTDACLVLQTRLFAYGETQRYRLGINFPKVPVNKPLYSYNPTKRDGAHNTENYGSDPNYIPSEFNPDTVVNAEQYVPPDHDEWVGQVTSFKSQVEDIDFVQPREFWQMLAQQPGQQEHLINNVATNLSRAVKDIRQRTYGKSFALFFLLYRMFLFSVHLLFLANAIACANVPEAVFTRIDPGLGAAIQKATEALVPIPVTMKPQLPLAKDFVTPEGTSVLGGKPDGKGNAGTA